MSKVGDLGIENSICFIDKVYLRSCKILQNTRICVLVLMCARIRFARTRVRKNRPEIGRFFIPLLFLCVNGNLFFVFSNTLKFHNAVNERKQRIVLAD